MSRLSKRLSDLNLNSGSEEKQKDENILTRRTSTIQKEFEEERTRRVEFKIPHEQVQIPVEHDRIFEDLNEETCADLISAFKACGQQNEPAIVRPINNPPNDKVKYELCTGARRYWTSQYLGWKLLIEVRDISDREVFELNDIENRARKDVNDYERGRRYLKALHDNLYDDQQQLAERLGISRPQTNKLLTLGALPLEVVTAYPSKADIKIRHAEALGPLIRTTKGKQQLIKRAEKIAELKAQDRTLTGSKVFKLLAEETREKKSPKGSVAIKEVKNETGTVIGSLKRKGSHFIVTVSAHAEDNPTDVLDKLKGEIEKISN